MPAGDRTGPWGLGPMTGRAAGYCAGYPVPGYMNPIPGYGLGFGFGRGWGRGFGFGRGFGRGWGRGFGRRWGAYPPMYSAPTPYASMPYAYRPPIQYNYPAPYMYPQMYPPVAPYGYPPIYPPPAPYGQHWGPAQYPGYW